MNLTRDIYLRAHTVVLDEPERPARGTNGAPPQLPKWPEFAVVCDCESRTDIAQELTFGFYRVLRLEDDDYHLIEEGAFFDEGLRVKERKTLETFIRTAVADTTSFPPRFPLRSRSEFVKNIFYWYARKGALIVGFNICFDLARLARKWSPGDKAEWSLVLSEYPDGNENLNHPRVLVEPLGSKKAFISFRPEWIPKDKHGRPLAKRTNIDKARFLDLSTLLSALFDKQLSLKGACALKAFEKYDLPQKKDQTPTGKVTVEEIEYARHDVRCTATLLNAAKKEFDLHPIERRPDQTFSPASFVKSYLQEMGIQRPAQKFDVPNEILGYAMESFTAGRSETKLRHIEVPVTPVDFTSEYPTVCVLLQLMKVLTAKRLTFEDATSDVQKLLGTITLENCFERKLWPKFRFFALIVPQGDILPVRTMYGGLTQNIGNNYLTDDKPLWVAGPDLINSVIQTGKAPRILRAIRVVPHGKQAGLKPIRLRGAVRIDPRRDDFFRKIVEERRRHKSDPELYHWLKIFANSIYGCFAETNPETLPRRKAARVHVYSGEESFITAKRHLVERPGKWYAPYLASLITSGGRLLLGMLEKCIHRSNGVYVWADTDALGVVAAEQGGTLANVPGCENTRILPRAEVRQIVEGFNSLNPYKFGGSILRFTDLNYVDSDPERGFRQLLGFSISAKRYCLYERDGDRITVVDPKAHGLGYLYPPADSPKQWEDENELPKWVYEAWEFLLRMALQLKPDSPVWLRRPQMMRMAVTSHSLWQRMHWWKRFRPYNFFLVPILAPGGYPPDINPKKFTLVTPFKKDQSRWIHSVCVNIEDSKDRTKYRLTTSFEAPGYGERSVAVANTFEALLYGYLYHPESKSLTPAGGPCRRETFGRLQRVHVIAGKHYRIGKEADRRWEEGDDLEAAQHRPIEYRPTASRAAQSLVRPSLYLSRLVRDLGIRKLNRQGFGRRILEKISRRVPLNASTYRDYERRIEEYARTRRREKATRL
jgi:hypothetical protein